MNFRFWEDGLEKLKRLIKPYGLELNYTFNNKEYCKNCNQKRGGFIAEVSHKILPLGQTVNHSNNIAVYCYSCDAITYDDKPMYLPEFLLIYEPRLHPKEPLELAIKRVEEIKQDLMRKLIETERFNTSIGPYR